MVIDAVIIDAEFKMESAYSEYGCFIKELSQYDDVRLVDYNYQIEVINENSNLDGFDIVKH